MVCADELMVCADESMACADELMVCADELMICAECGDLSTDERVVLNREVGIGERGGSVSIRATGRLSSCSAIGTS